MTTTNKIATKHIAVAIVTIIFFFFALVIAKSQAQQSAQVFITWEAQSYAPSWFRGKVMPTENSVISASLEVIDGGKIIDLSAKTIYWYLGNRLIENRRGIQRVKFNAPDFAPDLMDLRVQIPDYPGGLLLKEIEIPVVRPEAVIESPYPENTLPGLSANFRAIPYFFNMENESLLGYSWRVNGKEPEKEGEPNLLVVNINPDARQGSTVMVSLTIENAANRNEAAVKTINLTFNP